MGGLSEPDTIPLVVVLAENFDYSRVILLYPQENGVDSGCGGWRTFIGCFAPPAAVLVMFMMVMMRPRGSGAR